MSTHKYAHGLLSYVIVISADQCAQFTRRIVGFKKEESDYLLKFLYDHIALGADLQARMKWEKGSVIVWDNRVTVRKPFVDESLRHALTPEHRPIPLSWTGKMANAGIWLASHHKPSGTHSHRYLYPFKTFH